MPYIGKGWRQSFTNNRKGNIFLIPSTLTILISEWGEILNQRRAFFWFYQWNQIYSIVILSKLHQREDYGSEWNQEKKKLNSLLSFQADCIWFSSNIGAICNRWGNALLFIGFPCLVSHFKYKMVCDLNAGKCDFFSCNRHLAVLKKQNI